MLNLILETINVRYCRNGVNEYCKDSKSYLEDWETWKKSFDDNNCILDTFDVVNLYPSLSIVLVSKALVEALELSSEFETSMIKYWIKTIGPEKFEVPFIYKSSKI